MAIHRMKKGIETAALNAIREFKGELKPLILEKTFISGGSFYSLYHKKDVKDYDFFFINQTAVDEFLKLLQSSDCFYFQSKHAINMPVNGNNYQFITSHSGSPENITNTFDFKHTMNFYRLIDQKFDLTYLHFIETRELEYNENAKYPIASLSRMAKFIKNGMKINDQQILYVSLFINSLSLHTNKEIEASTTGLYIDHKQDFQSIVKKFHNRAFGNKLQDIINE